MLCTAATLIWLPLSAVIITISRLYFERLLLSTKKKSYCAIKGIEMDNSKWLPDAAKPAFAV